MGPKSSEEKGRGRFVTPTYRGKGHVETEAEVGDEQPQAKEC